LQILIYFDHQILKINEYGLFNSMTLIFLSLLNGVLT